MRWDHRAISKWTVEPAEPNHAAYVYVAWGKRRRPLYVGFTTTIYKRLYQHLGRSSWAAEVIIFDVHGFDSELSAREAEQAAITDLNPIHNRYRPQPPTTEKWQARQALIIATVQNRGRAA